MARSEFRWNKKRKHYAYIHKDDWNKRINIIISSKPHVIRKGNVAIRNVPLYRHPNAKKNGQFYAIPRNYADDQHSFDNKIYKWEWDINDKRKIKRIKKNRRVKNIKLK